MQAIQRIMLATDDVHYYSKLSIHDPLINKTKRVITSSVFFMLAYLLANMLHQGMVGLFSIMLGYTAEVSLHYVVIKPFETVYWNTFSVLFIFGTPPILCVWLGYTVRYFLLSNKKDIYSLRLFFYWLQVCLYMIFIGQLFILPIGTSPQTSTGLYQTFSIISTWFSIPFPFLAVALVLALVAAIALGFFISNEVLRYSFSSKLIQTARGKYSIALQVYILPLFVATPIVVLLGNSMSYLLYILTMPLFMLPVVGMFVRYKMDMTSVRCNKVDVLNTLPVVAIIFTIASWVIVLKYIK